jgi:hypothetical protein
MREEGGRINEILLGKKICLSVQMVFGFYVKDIPIPAGRKEKKY